MPLKAKFQIGSVHGSISYESTEKVFHPSDVPAAAKEARTIIKEFLRSDQLRTKQRWASSTLVPLARCGKKQAPWDSDGSEERKYREMETAAKKAARAMIAQEDTRKFNLSTSLDLPKPRDTESTFLQFLSTHRQLNDAKLPADRMSLLVRERLHVKEVKRKKEEDRFRQTEELQSTQADQLSDPSRTWNKYPFDPHAQRARSVKEQAKLAAAQIAQTYTADALAKYAAELEAAAAAASNSSTSSGHSSSRRRTHHDHKKPSPRTSSSSEMGPSEPPIFIPAAAFRQHVYKSYEHTGCFGPDVTLPSEEREDPDNFVWSCCLKSGADAMGCHGRTITDQRKWMVSTELD